MEFYLIRLREFSCQWSRFGYRQGREFRHFQANLKLFGRIFHIFRSMTKSSPVQVLTTVGNSLPYVPIIWQQTVPYCRMAHDESLPDGVLRYPRPYIPTQNAPADCNLPEWSRVANFFQGHPSP